MIARPTLLSPLWRGFLGVLRTLLSVACFIALLSSSTYTLSHITLLGVILVIYSLVALFWNRFEQAGQPLLILMIDTVFFLICVSQSGDHAPWLSSFFVFYLLLTAALLYSWREVLMEATVCLGFFYLAQPPHVNILGPIAVLLSMFGCIVSFYQRALVERLSGASQQAVAFREEAENAREAERQRIAADFHDGPLQSFISFQMRLEVLRKVLARDTQSGLTELEQLQELCRQQVTELRAFVKSMRPVQYGETLGPAFRRVADDFQKDSGIPVSLSVPDGLARAELPKLKELIPILREALHNVQKHSRAQRVAVNVVKEGEEILLSVEDDGEGFPFSGTYTLVELERLCVGPASIQRRVRNLNGDLTLESHPGRGSTLNVRVPV